MTGHNELSGGLWDILLDHNGACLCVVRSSYDLTRMSGFIRGYNTWSVGSWYSLFFSDISGSMNVAGRASVLLYVQMVHLQ